MQIDFHYYAIFTLCRLAGIKDANAKIIAYASQHTDDAKYDHVLNFQSGGRFEQQMSAHSFVDLKFFSKDVGYDIFIPFHFLPGVEGETFYERLLCRKNSGTCNLMLEETVNQIHKPYGLHRLGIALHVFADSWAHQGFHGLQKIHNEIDKYTFLNKRNSIIEQQLVALLPAVGHVQVFTAPDQAFLHWKYMQSESNEWTEIGNTERFMEAAYYIYRFLVVVLKKKVPDLFEDVNYPWRDVSYKLCQLFSEKGKLQELIQNWTSKLKSGYFGFTSSAEYDDREWFKKAVIVNVTDGIETYDKTKEFTHSDWKYFQDALVAHSFYVKHELLPQFGIIS